jgi:acetolactate synthase-1/2/3 large subunit
MMGLSAIPASSRHKLGMVGMHGIYSSTVTKNHADLVIGVGVRFSDRATGNKSAYLKGSKIIHIDTDSAEINKNIVIDLGIVGNAKTVLSKLLARVVQQKHPAWWEKIAEIKAYEEANKAKQDEGFTPYRIIDAVSRHTTPDTPVATDVGQHQMWVAQRYPFEAPRTFVTSGGLGTMGFGLGAAIGAAVGTEKRTVLFTGDGSFGMNLNEMATAVSQKAPVVVMVMNNGVLGMVRQWQTMFYDKHYSETTLNRKTDFVKLAEAFGAVGFRATNEEELEQALTVAFQTDGPVLIDCIIDCDERVLPMIPPGGTVNDLVIK